MPDLIRLSPDLTYQLRRQLRCAYAKFEVGLVHTMGSLERGRPKYIPPEQWEDNCQKAIVITIDDGLNGRIDILEKLTSGSKMWRKEFAARCAGVALKLCAQEKREERRHPATERIDLAAGESLGQPCALNSDLLSIDREHWAPPGREDLVRVIQHRLASDDIESAKSLVMKLVQEMLGLSDAEAARLLAGGNPNTYKTNQHRQKKRLQIELKNCEEFK